MQSPCTEAQRGEDLNGFKDLPLVITILMVIYFTFPMINW